MKQLRAVIQRNRAGDPIAMPSICSSHPDVITAALLLAEERGCDLLLEATSNQVNQFGGYTGMTPTDFVTYARKLAEAKGIGPNRLLFGGDHLGPQAWKHQSADTAMTLAIDLVKGFVAAGFEKIHLDCSEGCAGEDPQVSDATAAERAALLAKACEEEALNQQGAAARSISYCFGTEVPPPGGARADDASHVINPTTPQAAASTVEAHAEAFGKLGLEHAWAKAVALVIQPGLEFSPETIFTYKAEALPDYSGLLTHHPHLCFEAHSTDYQRPEVFPQLAKQHFAIQKVGPALTRAYHSAMQRLDAIAELLGHPGPRLADVMEHLMVNEPHTWTKHYAGTTAEQHALRHRSFADRIRYYWPRGEATRCVGGIRAFLANKKLHEYLLMPAFTTGELTRAEVLRRRGEEPVSALILSAIQAELRPYYDYWTE